MRHGKWRPWKGGVKDVERGFNFEDDIFTIVTGRTIEIGQALKAESGSEKIICARPLGEAVIVASIGEMKIQGMIVGAKEGIDLFDVGVFVLREMARPISAIGNDQQRPGCNGSGDLRVVGVDLTGHRMNRHAVLAIVITGKVRRNH